MKGVGGPLLCIGDLLSDLAEKKEEEDVVSAAADRLSPPSSFSDSKNNIPQSLTSPNSSRFFSLFDFRTHNIEAREEHDRLNQALDGTDHSWTALTLKLCTSLETANKLVQSTNSNVRLLSEKVEGLEKIIKRGDSAVAAAKAIHVSLNQKGGPFNGSQNV
ncbi:GRAS family transcription factor [Salix suchowensis]|nr:GRAS family transcription factor [Salix suchowensis]